MANSGGLCDLHPGITTGLSASPVASHSGTPRTLSLFRQTNLHSRHSSTLSKTTSLSCHASLLTGEHPNLDASFSVSLSTEPLLPSEANVLRADGIVDLLKTYPNQRFIDIHIYCSLWCMRWLSRQLFRPYTWSIATASPSTISNS